MRALTLTLIAVLLALAPAASAITVSAECGENESEAASGICTCDAAHSVDALRSCILGPDPPGQGCRPTCL